jgi:hypothetical protein
MVVSRVVGFATSLCQSDGRYPPPHGIWSHEIVVLDGMTTTVKVAHVRLSRMMSVRGYPREAQEIVFDAHERAFAFFRGATPEAVMPREPSPTP